MTLPVASRNDYIGTGLVDTYAYGFKVFAATDLQVTVRNTSDAETELAYPADFDVTGVGTDSGGTVILAAGALADDYVLTIRRLVVLEQETDVRNQQGFFPEVLESTFDYLTMIDQQQQDQINRSVKLPVTASPSLSPTLPLPVGAGYIRWNEGGTDLEAVPGTPTDGSLLNQTVQVFPPVTPGGAGRVILPGGVELDTTGTTTAGLQEAIDYAMHAVAPTYRQLSLEICGPGDGDEAYNCSTTLVWPPMQNVEIDIGAVTINCTNAGVDGMTFDSCEQVKLRCAGQIVRLAGNAETATVRFKPQGFLPYDGVVLGFNPQINDSSFKFVTLYGGGDATLLLDPSKGSITTTCIESLEIAGIGIANYGVKVSYPGSSVAAWSGVVAYVKGTLVRSGGVVYSCKVAHTNHVPANATYWDVYTVGFSANTFNFPHVHDDIVAAFLVGAAAATGGAIGPNEWNVGFATGAGAANGIDTHEAGGKWRISEAYGPTSGKILIARADAVRNEFWFGAVQSGGLFQDDATVRSNVVHLNILAVESITPTSSPMLFPSTADAALGYSMMPQMLTVYLGTVSKIEMSPNWGTNWLETGVIAGCFYIPPGSRYRITYSAAPGITRAFVAG